MKFLNVNEILDIIDKQFGYEFEGKDKEDHLISNKTWNKYVREFLDEKIDGNKSMVDYSNKIFGEKRHTKYREDFVKEVINYRNIQLNKQFNSNRKTTVDHETIEAFETIASALDVKVAKEIYNKRIPITQYKKKQEEKFSNVTKEDIVNMRDKLLQIVIDQLIDMEKINHDVYQSLIFGDLDYGYAYPLEMNEDEDGYPLGFKMDAKNYLKDNIRKELVRIRG